MKLVEEQIAADLNTTAERERSAALQVRTVVEQQRSSNEEQAVGVQQIAQALAQMERVTQSTAANSEQSAAASGVAEIASLRNGGCHFHAATHH
jgi:methyl-accepting chemotaxis protein